MEVAMTMEPEGQLRARSTQGHQRRERRNVLGELERGGGGLEGRKHVHWHWGCEARGEGREETLGA